jgi:hypothetical protein
MTGGWIQMFDDTGFRHVRVKAVAPGLGESAALLDRLFENPNVSASVMGAGIVDGRPYFEVDLFGATSQVDEVLAHASRKTAKAWEPDLEPQEAHV